MNTKPLPPIRLTIADRVYVQAVTVTKTRFGYEAFPDTDSRGFPVYALPGGGRATEEQLR